MKLVIVGIHHTVDLEDFSEGVSLLVQAGGVQAEVETTEDGLKTILELAQACQATEKEAPSEDGALPGQEVNYEDFDDGAVTPFGFGESDG